MYHKYMELALIDAKEGVKNNEGGPFGALITDSFGNIISVSHNQVLKNIDPTSHAEIEAIRSACKKLNTIDLKECILYTTCEPCPMCLSAIIWSNIEKVYYACNRKDANNIGFRDDAIYEYLNGNNKMLELKQLDKEDILKFMNEYKEDNKEMY